MKPHNRLANLAGQFGVIILAAAFISVVLYADAGGTFAGMLEVLMLNAKPLLLVSSIGTVFVFIATRWGK